VLKNDLRMFPWITEMDYSQISHRIRYSIASDFSVVDFPIVTIFEDDDDTIIQYWGRRQD
jgi:hypothetical protein